MLRCGIYGNFLLFFVKFCYNRYGFEYLLWYLFYSFVEFYEFLENKMVIFFIQIIFYIFYNIYVKCYEREVNDSNYVCIKS